MASASLRRSSAVPIIVGKPTIRRRSSELGGKIFHDSAPLAYLRRRRGLMQWRAIILAAALLAGVSYLFADHASVGAAAHTVWKGAGVGLLAVYAASRARGRDGWLLVAVLALGALGDVLLEIAGLSVG